MITRRSFMAALTAAFATSVMAKPVVMPEQVRWELFTDLDAGRWDLSTPWAVDEKVVATDGRLLLAVLDANCAAGNNLESRRPNLALLPWDKFTDVRGWRPSSAIEAQLSDKEDVQSCGYCLGTGRIGPGVSKILDRAEDGEPWQMWIGGEQCSTCKGEGWIYGGFVYQAGPARFAAHYIERIRTMGDFDFAIEQIKAAGRGNGDVMLFRNSVGAGFLMGLEG